MTIQKHNFKESIYGVVDTTCHCDVYAVVNSDKICFFTAIESINYLQLSSYDYPSEELAMILQSISYDYGIVDTIRPDHKNNTVFVYSSISKQELMLEMLSRF